MVRRSTIVVIFIFGVLLILALYLQKNNSSDSAEEISTATPVTSLFDISLEDITRLMIASTGGNQLILEKESQGDWQLIEPSGYSTDQDKAKSIINDVLSLEVLTKLETLISLDALGLDFPSYRISLKTGKGVTSIAVVGNATATNSGYYVKIGDQSPVVVSKTALDVILEYIGNPPIVITPTPTINPQMTETQIPELTPTP